VNRQAQAVVLLLFGGAIVKASVTDMYLRYVKEGLRPFLIAAGLVLVAAAVMTLWYDLRSRPAPQGPGFSAPSGGPGAGSNTAPPGPGFSAPSGGPGAGSGTATSGEHEHHGGHAHEPRVGWLLILPVLGLLLVAPPALGSYAAGQAGSVLTAQNSASDYPALPPGDPVPVTLLDYASRAVFDSGRSLTGRNLQLAGFVTPGADGQPMLARMVLSCCAADGRPIKVALAGDVPTAVPADTWVQVTGRYLARTGIDGINQAAVPYLEVTSWREIPPPRQQYE
jgi:uncharacterized repeat protein (TIGR03943 family)